MPPLTILITGANRGIGFSILHSLALHSPQNIYLLGTRTLPSGTEALDTLHTLGIPPTTQIHPIVLDISNDSSIQSAVSKIRTRFKKLDILINNAGVSLAPESSTPSDIRAAYASTYDTNVSGVVVTTSLFLPLLKESSPSPRVINVSSARGSISLVNTWPTPPLGIKATDFMPYMVSKAALNMLTVLFAREEKDVGFWCCTPGLCRTRFSGFMEGAKEPEDGARVVVELVLAKEGVFESGFWEFEEEEMRMVPW